MKKIVKQFYYCLYYSFTLLLFCNIASCKGERPLQVIFNIAPCFSNVAVQAGQQFVIDINKGVYPSLLNQLIHSFASGNSHKVWKTIYSKSILMENGVNKKNKLEKTLKWDFYTWTIGLKKSSLKGNEKNLFL